MNLQECVPKDIDIDIELLKTKIKQLRFYKNIGNPESCIFCGIEKYESNTFVVIFRTKGCSWARICGCTMCGYINDCNLNVGDKELEMQLNYALQKFNNCEVVKIYTSGSYLDVYEISKSMQLQILQKFIDLGAKKIVIESRPEYITLDSLKTIANFPVTVAIGLESANNEVLEKCICKGFSVEDYVRAVKLLSYYNIHVKTYILLKPPFISEKTAIEDAINTINFAEKYSIEISINAVNVQKNTLVEYLYLRNLYRPPWLWSILEVLKRTYTSCKILVSLAGICSAKGPHNCFKCDSEIKKYICEFNRTQKLSLFENLSCECYEQWCSEKTFMWNICEW